MPAVYCRVFLKNKIVKNFVKNHPCMPLWWVFWTAKRMDIYNKHLVSFLKLKMNIMWTNVMWAWEHGITVQVHEHIIHKNATIANSLTCYVVVEYGEQVVVSIIEISCWMYVAVFFLVISGMRSDVFWVDLRNGKGILI